MFRPIYEQLSDLYTFYFLICLYKNIRSKMYNHLYKILGRSIVSFEKEISFLKGIWPTVRYLSLDWCFVLELCFIIFFLFRFYFIYFFPFSVFCVVLFSVLLLHLYCLFPIFVHVLRPLSPGGNPIAANKYHVMLCHIMFVNIQVWRRPVTCRNYFP